jgi:hypothetical protein
MVKELTAEQAKEIAIRESKEVNRHLEIIFELIKEQAEQGNFKLRYPTRKGVDVGCLLRERLLMLGYAVEICAADKIDLIIEWM